ncbi:PH domain-containing protein [Streptomyces sp. ICN441]|uniref:PH domain-containing protein n=1 Tax=Streptomyces sp. ICN441 TaxID=2558286 RepID=UPI00048850D4|nr:PH domain-containing protein [Streptomyces sp. ICN441]TFE48687.1 PH domain-containing protein [Streptomyces sp. ICN441]
MDSPEQPTAEPVHADRVYRSHSGIATGVLLLAFTGWIGGDALLRGAGLTPWVALAGLLVLVPLIVAFTLRPAVFANDDRLRIRNPFRTIVLPWRTVAEVRAAYSSEVLTEDGAKYQLWAVPVSLRQRKSAARRRSKAIAAGDPAATRPGGAAAGGTPPVASGDRTIAELRGLSEQAGHRPAAAGEPRVRWAYEIAGPVVVGAVALVVLLAVG